MITSACAALRRSAAAHEHVAIAENKVIQPAGCGRQLDMGVSELEGSKLNVGVGT